MISLSQRQQDALRFIIGFQQANGQSPSYVEIGYGIGLYGENSKGWVGRLMRGLQERGAIRHRPNVARSIEVLETVSIPRAPDGEPLHFVRIGGLA